LRPAELLHPLKDNCLAEKLLEFCLVIPTRKKHWEIAGVSWDILNFIGFIGFNGFCLVGIINRYLVITIEQRWPEKVLLMMSFPNSLVLETL